MTAPDERKFKVFRRGQVRDTILAAWRNSLRKLTNPITKQPFTEDEIIRATQVGSRFYIESDAIDVVSQANQQRALFLADQTDPRKANSVFLRDQHGRFWLGEDSILPAVGSSGFILAQASPGSIFPGSTTVPDLTAAVATFQDGTRYQVTQTTVAVGNPQQGLVTVLIPVRAVDVGSQTNLPVNSTLKWSANSPLGAAPESVVTSTNTLNLTDGLTGGFDKETEASYADRIEERIRLRPASGNPAHALAWGRQATVAVESVFVYPTALNAGSTVIAVTEKRSTTILEGPLARLPSIGTLSDVSTYLVPPNSPVFPNRAFVLVTGWNPQSSDMVISIAMAKGSVGGWDDADPWPKSTLVNPFHTILTTNGTDQFTFNVDSPLPGAAALLLADEAPSLMLWDETTSRFVELEVAQVALAGNLATVDLVVQPDSPEPTTGLLTLVTGMSISPGTDRNETMALSFESFFDSLGPGELIDLQVSALGARGFRTPVPSDSFPQRAGQIIIPFLIDALGGVASSANLDAITREAPDLPGSISDGPNMVTLGKVNVYPL